MQSFSANFDTDSLENLDFLGECKEKGINSWELAKKPILVQHLKSFERMGLCSFVRLLPAKRHSDDSASFLYFS